MSGNGIRCLAQAEARPRGVDGARSAHRHRRRPAHGRGPSRRPTRPPSGQRRHGPGRRARADVERHDRRLGGEPGAAPSAGHRRHRQPAPRAPRRRPRRGRPRRPPARCTRRRSAGGINVEFIAPTPGEPMRSTMRVWERGAGITDACGTGRLRGRRAGRTTGASSASGSPCTCRAVRSRSIGRRPRIVDCIGPSHVVATVERRPMTEREPVADETHRGAFGEFGGESGRFIERTFRERIVLVGVTLAGGDRGRHRGVARRARAAGRHRRRRRGRPRRAAPATGPTPPPTSARARPRSCARSRRGARLRHRRVRRRAHARRSSATSRSCSAARPSTAPR